MDLAKLRKIIERSGDTEAIKDFEHLTPKKGQTLTLSTLQKPGEENPGTWKVLDKQKG